MYKKCTKNVQKYTNTCLPLRCSVIDKTGFDYKFMDCKSGSCDYMLVKVFAFFCLILLFNFKSLDLYLTLGSLNYG